MPDENRPSFDIPRLAQVDQILSDDLGFLGYSTQKRNVAYLWQFLQFQRSLLDRYDIYGSVRKSMIRSIVLITTNIIEYLLFMSVREKGRQPGHALKQWINQAASLGLIDDDLKEQLHRLRRLRSRIHPDAQTNELDYDSFDDHQVSDCVAHIATLRESLKEHFQPSGVLIEPSLPIS